MARQIVHDDHVAGPQFGCENFGDICLEPVAVDGGVQHHRRDHPGHAQPRHQRGGLAVTVWEAHPQTFAPGAAAMAAGHVGGGPGFVDKDEAIRVQIELAIEPVLALFQDIGAILLDGVASLFLRVMPRRTKKR